MMDASETASRRKVAVVVAIDVVGYSRLVERDESATINRLTRYWARELRPRIQAAGGRLIKLMGDGALAEFPSVGSAMETAVAFGRQVIEHEADIEPDMRIRIRAGIHVGDVMIEVDDMYGHGVNIAARLEGIAAPNALCLSDSTRSALGRRAPDGLVEVGVRRLKNIDEPIRVWSFDLSEAPGPRSARPRLQVGLPAAAGLAIAALFTFAVIWWPGGFASIGTSSNDAGPQSIVVLPFRNLSEDARQNFFVDGMTEDLILDLARLEDLFVVSRNTAFAYGDRGMSDSAIANELGVRYVMQGSVRRQGDRIRVNVAIVDGMDGTQLWGERYDERVDDIFEVQDRLKRQIVDALALTLREDEEAELIRRPTDNLEAYEWHLRGRAARQQGTTRSVRLAYYAFENAVALEPNFAPAIAALAELHATDFGGIEHPMDWERPPTVTRVAAELYAEQARVLAPESALPDIALARLRLFEQKVDEALAIADRAAALEPQLAEVWVVKARAETALGRHGQALATIGEAFRLDPKGTATQYAVRAMAEFGLGNYEAAMDGIIAASGAAKVSLNWQFYSVGIAAIGHVSETGGSVPLTHAIEDFLPMGNTLLTPDEVTLVPIFVKPDDQQRLVQGLGLADWFRPPHPAGVAFSALRVQDSFFGRESLGFCPSLEFTMSLRISESGQTLWRLRHDLSLAGTAELRDNRICLAFPAVSHLGELCFTVFENEPPATFSKDHAYSMVGPLVCHVTPETE